MNSRSKTALRKPAAKTSAPRTSAAKKSAAKAKSSKTPLAKPASKTGKLPEWNLADLYSGIDAPEVARDLETMDADCVAFETASPKK